MNIFVNHPSPYFTDCDSYGDGLIAYKYIDELARRGHHMYVTAPLVKLKNTLHPNIHLTVLQVSSNPSPDLNRKHRVIYALKVRGILKKLKRTVAFDIVHQLNPGTSWVHLFLPLGRIPFIVGPLPATWPKQTATPQYAGWTRDLMRRLVQRELFGKADRLLLPISSAKERLTSSTRYLDKIEVVPYGVDTNQFVPEVLNNPKLREPNILFLANLEHRKGIHTLLDAFPLVAQAVPNARLTIAGAGSESEAVRERVEELAKTCNIVMTGAVPRTEVAKHLNSSTIYCLPSFGEPFGMSALEAMACGKPVVTTAAGGLNDLVPAEGGIRVPPGNASELAKAIVQLATNPELCQQMGTFNRNLAVTHYDWSRVIDRLEKIYNQTAYKRFLGHRTATKPNGASIGLH